LIQLAVELVLQAALFFRGAAAALSLFAASNAGRWTPRATPCAGAIRAWVLRLGYASLTRPLPHPQRWAWLIDHTLQIGAQKLFVIVGVPLDSAPFGVRSLQLRDLHLIALTPMTESNQRLIETQLHQAVTRTGAPRQIVSDGAADLQKGMERFRQRYPQTVAVTDAAHPAANLLKHSWEKDPRWQEFTRRMNDTATAIRQTAAAHWTPPRLRNKARFMSVGVFVRFGCLLLRRLGAASPPAEMMRHYAWVLGFAAELTVWREQHALVQTFLRQVRVQGLFAGGPEQLDQAWPPLDADAHPTTRALRARLRSYVARPLGALRPQERLVGSTEVLESAFGVQKRLARDQAESGLTGLSLALGAVLGQRTAATVRADLEAVPGKQAAGWARRLLGKTVQWLRRLFFAEKPPHHALEPAPEPNPG
jgi:hypothetical protein